MKKDSFYNYGFASRCKDIEKSFVEPEVIEEDIQDRHDPAESFLKIVYALDPVTKLPTGDLNYLVSDKVNPEVKKWVLDNIMFDVSSAAMPAAPAGLSDDDIVALARDPKETPQDYMNRVNQYARTNRELYERMAKFASQSVESKVDVSSPGTSPAVSPE